MIYLLYMFSRIMSMYGFIHNNNQYLFSHKDTITAVTTILYCFYILSYYYISEFMFIKQCDLTYKSLKHSWLEFYTF